MAEQQSILDFLMNGAPQPDMVQNILTQRFQPTLEDASHAALTNFQSMAYGKPSSITASTYADQRMGDMMKQMALINTMERTAMMANGGQTGALIDRFIGATGAPLPTAISFVKSPGQGNTFQNGQVTNIPGATGAASNMAQGKTEGEKTGAENVARQANYTKAQSALVGFKQQSDIVTKNIDDALQTIYPGQPIEAILNDNGQLPPSNMSTGFGSMLSGIPNTNARKLNNYLNTIKANIGFDRLQQMRENSPTGGALGQVSDFENKLLQAVNGALDPGQGDQLAANLKTIRQLYPLVLQERQRAFDQDYGAVQPLGNNPQPVQPRKPLGNVGGEVPIIPMGPQTPEEIEYIKSRGGM